MHTKVMIFSAYIWPPKSLLLTILRYGTCTHTTHQNTFSMSGHGNLLEGEGLDDFVLLNLEGKRPPEDRTFLDEEEPPTFSDTFSDIT